MVGDDDDDDGGGRGGHSFSFLLQVYLALDFGEGTN